MSRKYCSTCGDRHSNGAQGLCDTHLQEAYEREDEQRALEGIAQQDRQSRLEAFLSLPDEEKWEKLFDLMEEVNAENEYETPGF